MLHNYEHATLQLGQLANMLFQFRFVHKASNRLSVSSITAHMPSLEESGLGMVEYESMVAAVSDVADPKADKEAKTTRNIHLL